MLCEKFLVDWVRFWCSITVLVLGAELRFISENFEKDVKNVVKKNKYVILDISQAGIVFFPHIKNNFYSRIIGNFLHYIFFF